MNEILEMKNWKERLWIADCHSVWIIQCGLVIEEIPAINIEFTCSSLRTRRIRALFSYKIVLNGPRKSCYCGINCYCNSGQGIECIRRNIPCKSCSYLTLKALVSLLLCRNFRTILGYSILLFWFFCFLYRKYILFCSTELSDLNIYTYIYVYPWKLLLLYSQLWKKPGELDFLFFCNSICPMNCTDSLENSF